MRPAAGGESRGAGFFLREKWRMCIGELILRIKMDILKLERQRGGWIMNELILNDEIITNIKREVVDLVRELVKSDLVEIILYGSCARGDYNDDSDIDIALLVKCDRLESQKYTEGLAEIATKLAMKYFAIVNFVCLPYAEFVKNSTWYEYFLNIKREGEVLYG